MWILVLAALLAACAPIPTATPTQKPFEVADRIGSSGDNGNSESTPRVVATSTSCNSLVPPKVTQTADIYIDARGGLHFLNTPQESAATPVASAP